MTDVSALTSGLEQSGFAILHDVIDEGDAKRLIDVLSLASESDGIRRRGGVLGIRNLLEVVPEIAELAQDRRIRMIAESLLGAGARAVRSILFDKTPETNWKVAWHQDLTIAVKRRIDVAGFGPWSVKAGVDSVQPPPNVLERMVTIRINLDDCGDDNGPLRVIPGSHSAGRLSETEIACWRHRNSDVSTAAPACAALVIKPLLLHASSAATSPRHRRVIHLDFAAGELPGGLEWHVSI